VHAAARGAPAAAASAAGESQSRAASERGDIATAAARLQHKMRPPKTAGASSSQVSPTFIHCCVLGGDVTRRCHKCVFFDTLLFLWFVMRVRSRFGLFVFILGEPNSIARTPISCLGKVRVHFLNSLPKFRDLFVNFF